MKTLKKLAAVATAGMLIPAACLNTALASPTQSSQPAAASVAIHTRSTVAFQGMRHCGHFANADGSMVISLVDALGAGDLGTRGYTVAAHGCNRVQCWDTSGVYLCNDNDATITVTGAQAGAVAQSLLSECCMFSPSGGQIHQAIMAGQQFTQWGWNAVVGYADCNLNITVKPSMIGGYGVNAGACMEFSGMVS